MSLLRKLTKGDAIQLASIANNKKIAANLRDLFPHPYALEDAHWFINFANEKSPDHRWAIEYKGQLCGIIGLHVKEDVYKHNLELGYWLGEEFWGKGIMTKAIAEVLLLGFTQLGCHRIYASVFSFNEKSCRVLEKNRFKREGELIQSIFKNGGFHNEIRYGLIKSDFHSKVAHS